MTQPSIQSPSGTERFAYQAADDAITRRQKQAIFVIASSCCAAGCLWTGMYALVFGWCLTTLLPALFVVIVGSALAVSHRTGRHTYAVHAQILGIMYVTAGLQWTMGTIASSGFVLAWAFCGPMTALAFFSLRKAGIFMALYALNILITVYYDGYFSHHGMDVSPTLRLVFFAMNVIVSSIVVFFFGSYFAQSAESQRMRAEELQHSLDDLSAKQLGPYTLEHKLGAGGMGVVYKARHALLRRSTAVKLLPVDKIGEASLARFEREVQNTANLTHPNIVSIHDYGRSADGMFYYAMEYLDGVDLDALVRRFGPLPPARAVHILKQVAEALDEAHHRGLVHRDIKPANIMLCRIGNRPDVVKVLDFGLVKEIGTDVNVTQDGSFAGTPAFLAPEAMTDPASVGPPADLYGLGAVAYWLLTGRTVFLAKTTLDMCAQQMHTQPQPPSVHRPTLPEALDELVLACLAKNPAERIATARALLTRLDQLEQSLPERWTAEHGRAWWDRLEQTAPGATPGRDSGTHPQTLDLPARVADHPHPAHSLEMGTTVAAVRGG